MILESSVSGDSISDGVSSVDESSVESQEDSVEDESEVSASEDLSIEDSSSSDDVSVGVSSLEDDISVSASEDLSNYDSLYEIISDELSSDQEILEEEGDSLEIDSMEMSYDSLEGSVSDSSEIYNIEEDDTSVELSLDDDSVDFFSEETYLDIESDSLEDEDYSIDFSLEDKIREFMSFSEVTFDDEDEESSSIDFSLDKADWWPEFNLWLEENDFVDEEESSSDEGSFMEWWDSSVDSLEGKLQAFMSDNEHIWDKYYEDDSSGEFSMDDMDWWSDFNSWLSTKDYFDEEESLDEDALMEESSDEVTLMEEYDSSLDSLEDKIREFMTENEDIWDKYYDEDNSSEDTFSEDTSLEDTSSVEFYMEKMDWWADFNRWLEERESDVVVSSEEFNPMDVEESYSQELALEDMIAEFMSQNEDKFDKRNDEDSSSGEVSMEDNDWWSEFNSWLIAKEEVSSSDMERDSMDESDPVLFNSSDESQSSSVEEKSSSSYSASQYGSSSEFGANFEESSSSSDEPCEKGKGWFKGGIRSPVIITVIVFLAIIVCLVIMETKRKRDRGRRSMRVQMLTSRLANDRNRPIKYLYKDNTRQAEETGNGPEYKAFTNLV